MSKKETLKIQTEDLKQYAKNLVQQVEDVFNIKVQIEFFEELNGDMAKIFKEGVRDSENRTYINQSTVKLNMSKIKSKGWVRVALAHEFAHLFPHDGMTHRKVWMQWCKLLRGE